MYHFVCILWNTRSPDSQATAGHLYGKLQRARTELKPIFSGHGMSVFAATPRSPAMKVYVLPQRRGVILGRLFSIGLQHHEAERKLILDKDTADAIVNSKGETLTESYWGSYIAFLENSQAAWSCVIRDCSGAIPCYRTAIAGVEVLFSDINDLAPLGPHSFSINERYLAGLIFYSDLQIHESAIDGVTEVLAGERVELSGESVRQSVMWDPSKIVAARLIENVATATSELRKVTQGCVDAWTSTNERVLLSLSGGLDSAIVLGCARNGTNSAPIVGLNQYCSGTYTGDERRYARAAAAHARVELIERQWQGSLYTPRLFDYPKTVKPTATDIHFMLEMDLRNEIAVQIDAHAMWTGQGGDHLFWAARGAPIAADYVHTHGIRLGLLPIVRDVARLSQRSYVSVLRTAIMLGRPSGEWLLDGITSADAGFLSSDALAFNWNAYIAHPWQARAQNLPKTKQLQIFLLADVLNRHRHLPRAERAYERHPLLSQPLIELCLQIPTYRLAHGGRQRSLARAAFKDCVPKEIIEREDKGDFSSQERDLFRQSEPFLCDLLLNGFLVRSRLVSRQVLEAYLLEGQSLRPEHIWPLRSCIAVEVWVETWRRAGLRIAA